MAKCRFLATACAAALLGACSSGDGGTPPPVFNAPGPQAAALNTTLGPLSFFSEDNFLAVNEEFTAISTSLTLTDNGATGREFVATNIADYENPGIVRFDQATNAITLDIVQDGAPITDTFGPLLLADPQDLNSLENDTAAVFIAAFPQVFPSGMGFNPGALAGDPIAADAAIEDLRDAGMPAAALLETILAIAAQIDAQDFFGYRGPNGVDFFQLKITGTNADITTNYVALGDWSTAATPPGGGDIVDGVTIYGSITPELEVPRTGTAQYNTTIVGDLLRQNKVEELRGGVEVLVDFGVRSVNVAVDADLAVSGPNGETIFTDFTTLAGTGAFTAGNRFGGALQGVADPTFVGEFQGAFFGPSAAEVGGTLSFSNTSAAATGAFVGPRE